MEFLREFLRAGLRGWPLRPRAMLVEAAAGSRPAREELVDTVTLMGYGLLMEINHSADQIRITAAKGIAFARYAGGFLTLADLDARLAELKARETGR